MKASRMMRRRQFRDKHLRKLETAERIAAEAVAEAIPCIENDKTDEVTGRVLVLVLWALHLDLKFGKDRMAKVVKSVYQFADIVRLEKIDIDEACQQLQTECKFDLFKAIDEYKKSTDKSYRERRDFLETYRFSRRITKADEDL